MTRPRARAIAVIMALQHVAVSSVTRADEPREDADESGSALERRAAASWGARHRERWMIEREADLVEQRRAAIEAEPYKSSSAIFFAGSVPVFLGDSLGARHGKGTGSGGGLEFGYGPVIADWVPLLVVVGVYGDATTRKSADSDDSSAAGETGGEPEYQFWYWTVAAQSHLLFKPRSRTPAYLISRVGAAALCVKDVGDRYGRVRPACPDAGVWTATAGGGLGFDFASNDPSSRSIGSWTIAARLDGFVPNPIFEDAQWVAMFQLGGNWRLR